MTLQYISDGVVVCDNQDLILFNFLIDHDCYILYRYSYGQYDHYYFKKWGNVKLCVVPNFLLSEHFKKYMMDKEVVNLDNLVHSVLHLKNKNEAVLQKNEADSKNI